MTLLLCLSPGLSLFPLLSCTLPGPSVSEVTTLWRYTNMFTVIIFVIFLTLGRYVPEGD